MTQDIKEELVYGFTQEINDKAENLINSEIYTRANQLIDECAQNGLYEDQILELSSKFEYEEPLGYWFDNTATDEEKTDLAEYLSVDSINSAHYLLDICDAQEVCDYVNVEPYTIEALEFYIVSDYLVNRLEEQGELICFDLMGFNIWGRTCSGQAIILDGTIQRIAKKL